MCNCHFISECCVMFSGVKLSTRSFNLFICLICTSEEIGLRGDRVSDIDINTFFRNKLTTAILPSSGQVKHFFSAREKFTNDSDILSTIRGIIVIIIIK